MLYRLSEIAGHKISSTREYAKIRKSQGATGDQWNRERTVNLEDLIKKPAFLSEFQAHAKPERKRLTWYKDAAMYADGQYVQTFHVLLQALADKVLAGGADGENGDELEDEREKADGDLDGPPDVAEPDVARSKVTADREEDGSGVIDWRNYVRFDDPLEESEDDDDDISEWEDEDDDDSEPDPADGEVYSIQDDDAEPAGEERV
ncbi:hypothetical protein LTR08_002432 [Meristemomyces frigidus]|nr:hypothetical protein LTR08_002432 [Meristemomyces frigidus]